MTVYTRPRATADRLLAKWGSAMILTRTMPGAYDPATGTVAAATVTTYTGVAFRENYTLRDIDGTLVKRGDVRLLISPKCSDGTDMAQPATDTDTILFDGTTYIVIGSDPLKPATEAAMFAAQCRGV